jgi:hypothetical protein
LKFVATQFDCNRNRETLPFLFQSFIEIKPHNNNLLIFVFFFSFLDIIERKKKTMADDDDLDINAINDLSSSSSIPPDIYSTIEKEQKDKQYREENVHNQVDSFSFQLFLLPVKIIYQLL